MSSLKIIAAVCGVGIVGGAIALLVTNPNQEAYEAYAVTQLQSQLTDGVCEDVPALLEGMCSSAVENNDQLLGRIIESSTTRRNYYVLSIYETDIDPVSTLTQLLPGNLSLSVGETQGVPSYHAETVGILGRFITYKTGQEN
ncbi:MAG: DUF4359 domain-containing protein [Cyanothece sp. SIO2G6]|nr:DUF4359 domain-containing protein [Cyanothece sp. SIO2G6]